MGFQYGRQLVLNGIVLVDYLLCCHNLIIIILFLFPLDGPLILLRGIVQEKDDVTSRLTTSRDWLTKACLQEARQSMLEIIQSWQYMMIDAGNERM